VILAVGKEQDGVLYQATAGRNRPGEESSHWLGQVWLVAL